MPTNQSQPQPTINRCPWCGDDPIYVDYHDHEWGIPLYDDQKLFEMLILEGAQAGLSWITVLKRRDGYRNVFDQFDVATCAAYTDQILEEKLKDTRIIRNRLKVFSVRKNALAFQSVQTEFGSFSHYVWSFVHHKPIKNAWDSMDTLPATTPLSDQLSKDLKKRGFTFVGSTIVYAYMQAIGMVNDHLTHCAFRR
jgi:DNA-3-methyladenine glycosylase I